MWNSLNTGNCGIYLDNSVVLNVDNCTMWNNNVSEIYSHSNDFIYITNSTINYITRVSGGYMSINNSIMGFVNGSCNSTRYSIIQNTYFNSIGNINKWFTRYILLAQSTC